MPSLFARIARYVPSPHRNPREDMLTQALAATLDSAEGLAGYLVADWLRELDPAGSLGADARICPQHKLRGSGDRIDLALEFRDAEASPPRLLVWVEVKHQAHLSGPDQLGKYHRQLFSDAQVADQKRLVFLGPAGYAFDEGEVVPNGTMIRDWHRVGLRLQEWLDAERASDARAAWIVREFLTHLEEEDLYVSKALTREQVEVLRGQNAARRSFAALVEQAGMVIDRWVEKGGLPSGDSDSWAKRGTAGWDGFWRYYGDREYDGTHAAFQWDFEVSGGRSRPCFGSGVSFGEREEPEESVWERLVAEGLERTETGERWPRAFRYRYPEEFAVGPETTLTDQAQVLAGWVLDSFRRGRRALGLPESVL